MHEQAARGRTVIQRLRLRGAELEPLSARLRLEAVLAGADLLPPGLPPSATVCIRRLMDPKPGVLSVSQQALRPPAAWNEALSSVLREQVARAARPARGVVPPGAEAVLFADPSELLACLASDVSRGLANAHWWWRGLFPNADLARTVVTEWLRAPEYVPSALEVLTRQREARAVVSLFSVPEARELLIRVVRVHGLTATALDAPARHANDEQPMVPVVPSVAGEAGGASHAAMAPWEPWAPEVRSLKDSREHAALLGVALTLRRAPVEARRSEFLSAVGTWRNTEESLSFPSSVAPRAARHETPTDALAVSAPPRLHTESAPDDTAFAAPVEEPTARPPFETAPFAEHVAGPAMTRAEASTASESVLERSDIDGASRPIEVSPSAEAPLSREASPASATEDLSRSPVHTTTPPTPLRELEPPSGRAWGLPFSTRLGGLFYLVNLGLFLELYGDFSMPAHPNLPLSLWDFVTLVGRRLCVDPRPSDPVWKVLALLAGRKPGVLPGQGFTPPAAWRIPPTWLRTFRDTHWTWSVVEGRLRVHHAAGFLVLDVPCDGHDAEALMDSELAPYASVASFTLSPGDETGPLDTEPLERWLGWFVPFCRARLCRALGVSPDEASALDATLLAHDARLHVTEGHVDVVLFLAQLPLAVRIAGLDRDIGWLPSEGRHLTFHFE
ncbi:hypothetical protein [Myxococcus qinghaiensis]|uniref:hypothetical protein n=1 Tax=Myxococcus qinghaiensis TaxID=2906758 RepID=UPI0020A7A3F9|nr:hypothetical protein [Myxococcus qinghaiensis]MCP3169237.1 hypothetical protein [Myxococcus qinghaiensis]